MVVSKRAYTPPTYAHQNKDRHLYIQHTGIHTCIHTHVHARMNAYKNKCIHEYMQNTCALYAFMHANTYIHNNNVNIR